MLCDGPFTKRYEYENCITFTIIEYQLNIKTYRISNQIIKSNIGSGCLKNFRLPIALSTKLGFKDMLRYNLYTEL